MSHFAFVTYRNRQCYHNILITSVTNVVVVECKNDQRRSVRSEPFEFSNAQINTAYQQLQDTVQQLSNKVTWSAHHAPKFTIFPLQVMKMERKCHYNDMTFYHGDSWDIPPCHHCVCKVSHPTQLSQWPHGSWAWIDLCYFYLLFCTIWSGAGDNLITDIAC